MNCTLETNLQDVPTSKFKRETGMCSLIEFCLDYAMENHGSLMSLIRVLDKDGKP